MHPKKHENPSCCKHTRQFNGGALGRNVSHTGDSGFDHKAWKLGVFKEKGLGLGEELARFHMIGPFKHQQTVLNLGQKGGR